MLFLDHSPDLSPIDLEIYKYVAAHIDEVVYMRIRELAQETHSSTASILRFCRKFGCEGFSEFKIKLNLYRKSLAEPVTTHAVDETSFTHFIQRSTEAFFKNEFKPRLNCCLKKILFYLLEQALQISLLNMVPCIFLLFSVWRFILKIRSTIL